jgi:biopolymer transport protein TolR
MAGGISRNGNGALDVHINLVPFVLLTVVTTGFLALTALWTQSGRLQVSLFVPPAPAEGCSVTVFLAVSDSELRLTVGGSVFDAIPFVRDPHGRLNLHQLTEQLTSLRTSLPQERITVQVADDVKYDDVVRIIDECIGAGLVSVQILAFRWSIAGPVFFFGHKK